MLSHMPIIHHGLTTNALIRRVRRHTGLTTLFRKETDSARPDMRPSSPLLMGQPLPAPVAQSVETPVLPADPWAMYSAVNTPVAVNRSAAASINPPVAGDQDMATPERFAPMSSATLSATMPRPPLVSTSMAPNQPSSVVPQTSGLPPTGQPAPTVQAKLISPDHATPSPVMQLPASTHLSPSDQQTSVLSPAVVMPTQNAMPNPAPQAGQAPAVPANVQSAEDRTWTRLQTIYRTHKAREEGVSNRDVTVQTQRAQPEPPARTESSATSTSGQLTPQQAKASPPDLNQPALAARFPQRQGDSPFNHVDQMVVANPSVQPESMPASNTVAQTVKPFESTESSANLSQAVESPPSLEMVWPVQRASDSTSGAEPPQGGSTTSRRSEPLATGDPVSQLDDSVQRRLATIKTGQPTDSAVDLISPRRPRPVRVPQVENSTAALIQRAVVPQLAPTQPAQALVDPAVVETEVGTLPTDLWRLIGETPPINSTSRQDAASVQRLPIDLSQPDAVAAQTSVPSDASMAVLTHPAALADHPTETSVGSLLSPVTHELAEATTDDGLPSNIQLTAEAGIQSEYGHQEVSSAWSSDASSPRTLDAAPKAASIVEREVNRIPLQPDRALQSSPIAEVTVQRQSTHELPVERTAPENLSALAGEPLHVAHSHGSNPAPVTSRLPTTAKSSQLSALDLPPTNLAVIPSGATSALLERDLEANAHAATETLDQADGNPTMQFSAAASRTSASDVGPMPETVLPPSEGWTTKPDRVQPEGETLPLRSPPALVQRTMTGRQKMATGDNALAVNKTQQQQDVVHNDHYTGQNVQREASDSAPPAETRLDNLATPAASNKPSAAPEIDTDELARQVYSQLKRKLTIERERQRPVVR